MNNELLLRSKNDIPLIEDQVSIHQPILNEISLIGEGNFFVGCQLLNFSKDKLSIEDKSVLEDKSYFEIFMSIMTSSEKLDHIFPNYELKFTRNKILLNWNKGIARINNENYDVFKDILITMFELNNSEVAEVYNPCGKLAEKIAEKLKKYKEKVAKKKGNEKQKVAIFSRFVSILSVDLAKDKNSLMKYTVPQLKDEFKRYQMKKSFDMYAQAKMAGHKI